MSSSDASHSLKMKSFIIAATYYVGFGSIYASGFGPACISSAETKLGMAKSIDEHASVSRRNFIAGACIVIPSIFNQGRPAHATYGADAKMVMPDVMQGISDR